MKNNPNKAAGAPTTSAETVLSSPGYQNSDHAMKQDQQNAKPKQFGLPIADGAGAANIRLNPPKVSLAAMRKLMDNLATESFTVQMLFWLASSGCPHIVDAAVLRREQIDLCTGLVRVSRYKTGIESMFCLPRPSLDLLKGHLYETGEEFVFPDLVHGRPNQASYIKRSDVEDPMLAIAAGRRAARIWARFHLRLGISKNAISHLMSARTLGDSICLRQAL